jgi:hypothetical protein
MPIPKSLEPWVAHPGDDPTTIKDPCYVDFRLQKDLMDWHPSRIDQKQYKFKHIADPGGQEFARVTEISDAWSKELADVMGALKLRPTKKDGHDVLLDDQIGNNQNILMADWKVTRWLVVKGVDSNLVLVHHDIITWTHKDGRVLESTFAWEPYPH